MISKNPIKKVFEEFVIDTPVPETKKHKILMVAAEASPYANVGGFASVVNYLSKALVAQGHDVRIFMPKFGFIDEEKYKIKPFFEGLKIPTSDEDLPELICNVKTATSDAGVVTYFLENMEYYEKRANVYGYSDDPTRWALLSRGALEFIKTGEFVPDIIHCNDWHTGTLPNYVKTLYAKDHIFDNIATVFTIHNLAYQGVFDHNNMAALDFDDGRSKVAHFFDERLNKQNFMRRGIMYADVVNTVSKTYSKEILTAEYGEGLDKVLLEVREKLFGIVNGIDYEAYNPATDRLIEQNYDIRSIGMREKNKLALQKEFDLPIDPDVPLLGFVGRLDGQKGIDMMVSTLTHVLEDFDAQFVQVGGGDSWLAGLLTELKEKFPDKVGIHPYPNFTLPKLVFAGTDMFLYPSRFEPCGLTQLEAMRYGSVPIVRKIGGLADTVENFDVKTLKGNGFVFTKFNEFSLFGQIIRGIELYRNKEVWRKLQKNAMSSDFSWNVSAVEYTKLYMIAKEFRRKTSEEGKLHPHQRRLTDL